MEIFLPNTFIEIFPLELRLLNSKWLILGSYKSPSQNEPTYVHEIQKLLTYYHSSYDNILLLGDFSMPFSNKNLKHVRDMFELNHLIKYPKAQTPHVLITSTLRKRQCFLLSKVTFLTTIVWFAQCFARHFAKVQHNLETTGIITTIINNSSKVF